MNNTNKNEYSTKTMVRLNKFLELLPSHGFKYTPAAIEAGYSPSYARQGIHRYIKQHVGIQARIKQLMGQNLRSCKDKVKALDSKLDGILDTCQLLDGQTVRPSIYVRCLELRYKRLGALALGALDREEDNPPMDKETLAKARQAARKLLAESGQTVIKLEPKPSA